MVGLPVCMNPHFKHKIVLAFKNNCPKERDCYDTAQFTQEVKDWHLTIIVLVLLAITYTLIAIGFPIFRPMPFLIVDGERPPAENVSDPGNKTGYSHEV